MAVQFYTHTSRKRKSLRTQKFFQPLVPFFSIWIHYNSWEITLISRLTGYQKCLDRRRRRKLCFPWDFKIHWIYSNQCFLIWPCRNFFHVELWLYIVAHPWVALLPRCLKITEKVSFNIASYVCNLSGQLLIKNVKNGQFGEFLKIWSLRPNSLPV